MEQALIDCVRSGDRLDLAKGEVVDEALMRSWGDSRTCPAAVIRDILRGRLVADPDPRGLRLRGARIYGRLDLSNLTTGVSLELNDCLLEEGILARGANLGSVDLIRCRIEHSDEPALYADGLTCKELLLAGATIVGHIKSSGAVSLVGARIGGSLNCSGA